MMARPSAPETSSTPRRIIASRPHGLRELARALELDYDKLLAPAGAADIVVREYWQTHSGAEAAAIKRFRAAGRSAFSSSHRWGCRRKTAVDAEHASSHHKMMVIDSETVTTGSLTFTKAAQEQHAESLLIIRDTALAAPYTQNWQAHPQYGQPYVGQGVR
jgi:phosphatidylserine/phosphatidylglycerophosphate/cardiolipin synthase-like enzyme